VWVDWDYLRWQLAELLTKSPALFLLPFWFNLPDRAGAPLAEGAPADLARFVAHHLAYTCLDRNCSSDVVLIWPAMWSTPSMPGTNLRRATSYASEGHESVTFSMGDLPAGVSMAFLSGQLHMASHYTVLIGLSCCSSP